MIVERRSTAVAASPARVFTEVERLGGRAGWPYANALWRVRGLIDRVVGGVGMRLGRRDPEHVRVGDAVDFWRVEEVRRPDPDRMASGDEPESAHQRADGAAGFLRLRAEMKVPGRAWLQYEVTPLDGGSRSRLVQTAFFEPTGLAGLAYWYALYPVHGLIFRGMVRALAARAAGPVG
jgi:hypothetical protein